jgi:hypothetical protein
MSNFLQESLIHPAPPPAVAWWPPAPGWWALATALLILAMLVPWAVSKVRRRNVRRAGVRQSLEVVPDDLEDRQWLTALNTQLKRILKRRGQHSALTLHGEQWLDYLCQSYPNARRSALQPLAADLYRPALYLSTAQRKELKKELRRWMRHHHV